MRQRLKCLLALLENDSVEHLVHGFLTLDHHRHGFDGLMVAMFNASEGQLECLRLSDANRRATVKLEADIEDTNHPLVRVLRNGAPEVWYALNRGVRIEDDGFRGFIEALPNGCSMYGVPLFDFQGRACGVIAVFAEDIDSICGQPRHVLHLLPDFSAPPQQAARGGASAIATGPAAFDVQGA